MQYLLFFSLIFFALNQAALAQNEYPFSDLELKNIANGYAKEIPFNSIPEEFNGDRAKLAEHTYNKMQDSKKYIQSLPLTERQKIYEGMKDNSHDGAQQTPPPTIATEAVTVAQNFDRPIKVSNHFTGEQGTALPNEAEISAYKKQQEQANKTLPVNLERSTLKPEDINNISFPTCVAAGTAVEKIKDAELLNDERSILDLLFVQHLPKEIDVAEIFGTSTQVVEVSEDFSNETTQAAIVMGVECLPTRLIRTASSRKWLEGKDALKNYDKNKKGELHPRIEEILANEGR